MSRHRPPTRPATLTAALAGLAAAAVAAVLAGCGSSTPAAGHPPLSAAGPTATATPLTTAAGSTAPVTAPAPVPPSPAPTTAPYRPTAPQPSPDDAASALVRAWSAGDRAAASAVAAPAAVSTLLAIPYPAGYVQPRGCTDGSTDPGTCTYRNTATNGIWQIGVARVAGGGGWYVTAVTPES